MAEVTDAQTDYDVVVIGGAFTGASFALLLKRWLPDCRILIIERQADFNRKVGEATVEVSAFFLYRVLGLYEYLAREHLFKHGLRYWFSSQPNQTLREMSEVGSASIPPLPAFQLDRAKLDQHLLTLATNAGCTLARPAKVIDLELTWPLNQVRYQDDAGTHDVSARWVIDASGRQAFIARREKLQQPVKHHPTAALWARWRGVADLDGLQMLGDDPHNGQLPPMHASRRLATNHFCGYGWWCWVIPLGGGETSIGLVYNKDLFQPPAANKPSERYLAFVQQQPGLRELVAGAELVDDDFHALGHLPYKTSRYMDHGWALIGDAASFMDPYYSPGLDHASISLFATAKLLQKDLTSELDPPALLHSIEQHNATFLRSYDRWLAALYEDKYELMGDAELLRCAFLLDTALYYVGMVRPIYQNSDNLANPAFGQAFPRVTVAYKIMRFFNRRLLKIARFRRQTGRYGRRNSGWQVYAGTFDLGWKLLIPLSKGIAQWLKLELEYIVYRLFKGRVPVSQPVAISDMTTR